MWICFSFMSGMFRKIDKTTIRENIRIWKILLFLVYRLTIGCNVFKGASSYGKFFLSMLSFSPMFSSIDELMKFSLPLKILPAFDWFLMVAHNGTTMTTPPLSVHGDVKQTENGLLLDGKSGWLSAEGLAGDHKNWLLNFNLFFYHERWTLKPIWN